MLGAVIFATKKHAKQKRMGGDPYILHPLTVAKMLQDKGFSQDYVLAGLFHDLLEDTDTRECEVLELSNHLVLRATKLVTKEKGYNPEEYKRRICKDEIAHMVKLADRLHNLRSAIHAPVSFRKRYVFETETYYVSMAKGTVFETEIMEALLDLKYSIDE